MKKSRILLGKAGIIKDEEEEEEVMWERLGYWSVAGLIIL